jgi:protein SCO1/2
VNDDSADHPGAHARQPDSPSAGIPKLLWIGLITIAVLAGFVIWKSRPAPSEQEAPPVALPAWKDAPDFTLTERDGRTVTLQDLRGKVWLANFVFTRCTGPCPDLSMKMNSIQRGLETLGPDVQLVTFSLEPDYDQPSVLQTYAKRFAADERRWWFLTGVPTPVMHKLVREGFLQPVVAGEGNEPIDHSTYFVLVDRIGRIRAFYPGLDPESKPKILRDIAGLLAEPPPA